MDYIKRDLEEDLCRFLREDKGEHIVLISGARQTGKSTLVENLPCSRNGLIINFWDEEREVIALRNARTFSEFETILKTVFSFEPHKGTTLILDEAQASEHLSSFIMEMQRKWRGQKVILLGSLLANLYKAGRPMPVGRTVDFTCRPLNFNEFLRFRGKQDYLQLVKGKDDISLHAHELILEEYRLYLQIGGLPGIVKANYVGSELILLFESFLNNIYRDADRFIDPETTTRKGRAPQYGRVVEAVMSAIAHHICSLTQNATLLSTDSPAYRTILPHVLDALASWHITYTLGFRTPHPTTKKGYSSKKYLFDTGVANFLLTRLFTVNLTGSDPNASMLLENAVLQDCIGFVQSVKAVQCYRSNNRVSTELDFVVQCRERLIPIEVKSSSSVKSNTLSQLLDFLNRMGISEGYVVYTGLPETRVIRNKKIRLIPPYLVTALMQDQLGFE